MKQKNKKAFTLIELLIVIAIIGILASIVLVSLNSARQKAKDTAVLATVSSVSPAAVSCIDEGIDLDLTTMATTDQICISPGVDNWPDITANGSTWSWDTVNSNSDAANSAFTIVATDSTATKTITCDTNSCVKVGF